jgi:hypothetical protein
MMVSALPFGAGPSRRSTTGQCSAAIACAMRQRADQKIRYFVREQARVRELLVAEQRFKEVEIVFDVRADPALQQTNVDVREDAATNRVDDHIH